MGRERATGRFEQLRVGCLPSHLQSVTERDRYAYVPPGSSGGALKVFGGVVLYGAMLGLLYATFALIRTSAGSYVRASADRPAG